MDNKLKIKIASLAAASIVLTGALIFKNDREEKVINRNNNVTYVDEIDESNKANIIYENDTVKITDSIAEFGVTNPAYYPLNAYKLLQYRDKSGYERFSVVLSYIGYSNDEKGNITKNYSFVDVFDKTLVLSCDSLDFETFASDYVDTVIYYGNLIDLKDIVIRKGLDKNYANQIEKEYINDGMLYTYDAAKYYLYLVNSSNWRNYEINKALIIK